MKPSGHPPHALLLWLAGLLVIGYSFTLLPPGVAWLVIGIFCIWSAWMLLEQSKGEPAGSRDYTSAPEVRALAFNQETPQESTEFTEEEELPGNPTEAESQVTIVDVLQLTGHADTAQEPEAVPAAPEGPAEADPQSQVGDPQPHSIRFGNVNAVMMPRVARPVPQQLNVQATTYQDGMPPKQHHVRIRLSRRSGRRRPL